MEDILKTLGVLLKRALFFFLAPIYVSLYAFMHFTFKWWDELKA